MYSYYTDFKVKLFCQERDILCGCKNGMENRCDLTLGINNKINIVMFFFLV